MFRSPKYEELLDIKQKARLLYLFTHVRIATNTNRHDFYISELCSSIGKNLSLIEEHTVLNVLDAVQNVASVSQSNKAHGAIQNLFKKMTNFVS